MANKVSDFKSLINAGAFLVTSMGLWVLVKVFDACIMLAANDIKLDILKQVTKGLH